MTNSCPTTAVPTQTWLRPVTTWVYKPEAANTVWSSWWWAVCRSKHLESSIGFGIINSITRLHLVGYLYGFDANSFTNSVHVQIYCLETGRGSEYHSSAVCTVCSNQQWLLNQDNKREHLRPTRFRHTAHEGSAVVYRREATLLGFKMGETGKAYRSVIEEA